MALVLPSPDPSSSISLCFHRPLSDREALDVASLLSLLQDHHVIPRRRGMLGFGPLIFLGASLVFFFIFCLPILHPLLPLFFPLSEKLKFQRRLRCLRGRFYIGELTKRITFKDTFPIFYNYNGAFFVGSTRRTWIIYYGITSLLTTFGVAR